MSIWNFNTPMVPARPHPFASRSGVGTNGNGSRAPLRTRAQRGRGIVPPSRLCQRAPKGHCHQGPPSSPCPPWIPAGSGASPLPPSFPPSLLPAPVSSALPRFQAPSHSKVVTNFQLQPGEPNGAENAPNLQPGPSALLLAGPALLPFLAGTPFLCGASLAPLWGRGAQGTCAELAPSGTAALGQPRHGQAERGTQHSGGTSSNSCPPQIAGHPPCTLFDALLCPMLSEGSARGGGSLLTPLVPTGWGGRAGCVSVTPRETCCSNTPCRRALPLRMAW